MTKRLISLIFSGVILWSCTEQKILSIQSPDSTIEVSVSLSDGGYPLYQIVQNGKTIIDSSYLGLKVDGNIPTFSGVSMECLEQQVISHKRIHGKKSRVEDTLNIYAVTFNTAQGDLLKTQWKLSNTGIAFRYLIDVQDGDSVKVEKERTQFNLSQAKKGWFSPYSKTFDYGPAYEEYYYDGVPSDTCSRTGRGWFYPSLFELNDSWVLITEMGFPDNYPATHLNNECGSSVYEVTYPYADESAGIYEPSIYSKTSIITPWRVVSIGSLSDVVEDDHTRFLDDRADLENFDWVQPGRASWSWVTDNNSPKNYDSMLPYIDFAAEMNWENFLVDANWNIMQGGDVDQLIEYADSLGVHLWLWYNSAGKHNDINELPRDRMNDRSVRQAEFELLAKKGIKGVKVDFFNGDSPGIMKLYKEILEDAATAKIMVNFHGCTLPKGWELEFPNLMTFEAVKGGEQYLYDSLHTQYASIQNTILPFTRNAIGSMDYTPVLFSGLNYKSLTTVAHEVATSIIFESAITHFADAPSSFLQQSDTVLSILKNVPAAWDETRLLRGYPGDYVVMARRSGQQWYVAGLNGMDKPKDIEVDLKEFGQNSSLFLITSLTDNGAPFEINADQFNLIMKPRGGFVAVFSIKE